VKRGWTRLPGGVRAESCLSSIFSSVKDELSDWFDSCWEAKMELFDCIEVFYKQRRRHSRIDQISPAAFEKRARGS
jgi:putative transposase